MGREFKNSAGGLAAYWFPDGSGCRVTGGVILAEDIPAFIEWLQAGPPKLKWRIVREFDKRPQVVFLGQGEVHFVEATDMERVEGATHG